MLQIVPSGTHIDFLGRRHVAFVVSAALLLASLAAAFAPGWGVRFGIDFAGGTEVALRFGAGTEVDEARLRALSQACGVLDPTVVRYGESEAPEFLIRFRSIDESVAFSDAADCPLTAEDRENLAAVDEATGADSASPGAAALVDRLTLAVGHAVGPHEIMRVEYVGPRVGDELRRDGLRALTIAIVLILGYIAVRFSTRFAPGAIVALLHDVGITAGIFVLFRMEFDLRVLAALLAIIGYSLNDTIIIYDRIRENMELRTKHDLLDVLNRSVNQTLSRTLLTSITTLAAVGCLLVLGGEVIRPFALAMAIGIVVGTYSSTFIAAPTLLFLEQRSGGDTPAAGAKKSKRAA